MLKTLAACAGFIALQAGAAHADYTTSAPYMTGSYMMSVIETVASGSGFNTLPGALPAGQTSNIATASFTYTGALDFANTAAQNAGATGDLNGTFGFTATNISGYTGTGTVIQGGVTVADYNTANGFLASSGSAANYAYASLYTIDLGVLAAGTILDITHDDGISIFQGSTQIGPTVDGPTSQVTDQVTLTNSADTTLYYSRQNGTPSILEVDVPEPVSMTLLGTGLIGLGTIARRRGKVTTSV